MAAICIEDSVSAEDVDFTSVMATWVMALTISVSLSSILPTSLSATVSVFALGSICASSNATECVAFLAACDRPRNSNICTRELASVSGAIESSSSMSCAASRQAWASSKVCIFGVALVVSCGAATSSLFVDPVELVLLLSVDPVELVLLLSVDPVELVLLPPTGFFLV